MAMVIGKLFLIDLSRIGTVERIVSFVGVGLLMLRGRIFLAAAARAEGSSRLSAHWSAMR